MRKFGQEIIRATAGKKIHGTGAIPGGINKNLSTTERDEFLKVKNILIELGFKEDKQYSYLLPIPFEKLSSMEDTIINICNRLDKAFTSQS